MWLLVECHVYLHLYAIIIEQAISEKSLQYWSIAIAMSSDYLIVFFLFVASYRITVSTVAC